MGVLETAIAQNFAVLTGPLRVNVEPHPFPTQLTAGVHKMEPAPSGIHLEYLGKKADGTQREHKMLLSQLYPAIQEYDGSYNKIPETASER